MYVCLCKNVTDQQIRSAVENGANSFRDVRKTLGVGSQCGQCACFAKEVTKQAMDDQTNCGMPLWHTA